MAQGAAMMTDTQLDTIMIIGSGWTSTSTSRSPRRCTQNIERVGMPKWDDKDHHAGARRSRRNSGVRETGLDTTANSKCAPPNPNADSHGRRLRRHRRRVLERADGDAALSRRTSRAARAQLGERDCDGDADRAQGRAGRARKCRR